MTSLSRFTEESARIALAHVVVVGDRLVHHWLQAHGAVETLSALLRGPLAGARSVRDERRLTRYRQRLLDEEPSRLVDLALARTAQVQARVITPASAQWPRNFDDLRERAPLAVWIRGHDVELSDNCLGVLNSPMVAVVGARAATHYGSTIAFDLSAALTQTGLAVVSGGAYGIDAAAHRGALAVGGPTIAVMASGIDLSYPAGHTSLFETIAAHGVLVTELPPGATPTRQGFLARNRLIAALGLGVVVVEAAARSGAISTVGRAAELGREVMAVPGPVTSMLSVGTHALIRDGAVLVTSADEVVEAMAPLLSVAA